MKMKEDICKEGKAGDSEEGKVGKPKKRERRGESKCVHV